MACFLIVNPLTGQLVAGLRHAKLVGREFRRVHPIQELLFLGDAFAGLDGVGAQAAVEALVAGVVEDAEHAALHARLPGRPGKGLELLRGLPPQFQPLKVGRQLIGQLLPAGLDGEVFLGRGNLRLLRIAILGDQVAGEAGKLVVRHFLNRTLAAGDRFARGAK